MKKYIKYGVFSLLLVCLCCMLCGCGKKQYSTVYVSADCGQLHNETISTKQEEMYWGFINRRFILIKDDKGVMQYVKVNNDIERHEYDLSAFVKNDKNYLIYAPNGTQNCKVGVDVSKHNKKVDWHKVKEAGIDFAMIRIGYRGYGTGKILKDETFDWNMSGTLVAGIPRGVYFYSQAISYEEGVEEAEFVLKHLKGYSLQYPIVLDTEDAENEGARTNELTVHQRMQACQGFLDTITEAGHEAMVYANKRWFVLNLDVGQIKDYEWWYAQYNDTPSFPYVFRMWQYTAKGHVDGIEGDVDLNIEFVE